MSPRGTAHKRTLIAGLALMFVSVMVLSVPSGTAVGTSSPASAGVTPLAKGAAYSPDAYMPDPNVAGNVTLDSVDLAAQGSAAASDYPTTVGTTTTWTAPNGGAISLDTPHDANPITSVNASAAVAPGVLQNDPTPSVNGCFFTPNATTDGGDPTTYCKTGGSDAGRDWWNTGAVDWATTVDDNGQPGTGGLVAHVTNETNNGEPDVVISANTSASQIRDSPMDIATAYVTIPTSSLVAAGYTSNGYTFLTLSYFATTSATGATNVEPYIGDSTLGATSPIPADTSFPTALETGAWVPALNLSTDQVVPCLAAYGDQFPSGEFTEYASSDCSSGPWTGGPVEAGADDLPVSAGTAAEGFISLPVSDALLCWSSPGVTCSSEYTTTTSVELGFVIATTPPSEGTAATTVTVTGLALTDYQLSLGSEDTHGYVCTASACGTAGEGGIVGQTAAMPTAEEGVKWYNSTTPTPIEGTLSVSTAGDWTGLTTGNLALPLTSLSPSWGNTGWLNDSATTEDWYEDATSLTNASVVAYQGPSGGLVDYQFNFSWPSSPDLSYYQEASNPAVNVFDTLVNDTTYIEASTTVAGGHGLATDIANAAFPTPGTEVVREVNTGWEGYRFEVYASVSVGGGSKEEPLSDTLIGQNPGNATVVYSIDYNATDFNAIILHTSACLSCGVVTQNPPAPNPLSANYNVTGYWILGLLAVAAVLMVVIFWGGEKEEAHKLHAQKRGTLRLNRRAATGSRSVKHATYERRTRQAYEHDGAGIGWFLVAALFGFGTYYWLTTSGLLGFTLDSVTAAATVVVLFVVMLVLLIAWESTKTVHGSD